MQISHRLEEHNLYGTSLIQQQNTRLSQLQSFSISVPNNACILANGCCCQVISRGSNTVTCMVFKKTEPVYNTPVDSRDVGIYKVQLSQGLVKRLPHTTLASKALCYTAFKGNCLMFIELLHIVCISKVNEECTYMFNVVA